jgi:hypothetical protein
MNEDYKSHLDDISEIRAIMERSTKLISLSGLSGVGAGLVALVGAWLAWRFLESEGLYAGFKSREYLYVSWAQLRSMILLAGGIMVVAGLVASFFSMRLARKRGLPILGTKPQNASSTNLQSHSSLERSYVCYFRCMAVAISSLLQP